MWDIDFFLLSASFEVRISRDHSFYGILPPLTLPVSARSVEIHQARKDLCIVILGARWLLTFLGEATCTVLFEYFVIATAHI